MKNLNFHTSSKIVEDREYNKSWIFWNLFQSLSKISDSTICDPPCLSTRFAFTNIMDNFSLETEFPRSIYSLLPHSLISRVILLEDDRIIFEKKKKKKGGLDSIFTRRYI